MATKMCHFCRPLFEPNEQTVLFLWYRSARPCDLL